MSARVGAPLVLITALASERSAVAAAIAEVPAADIVLLQTGVGTAAVESALPELLPRGAERLLLIGFAGGLGPGAEPGRVLLPACVRAADDMLTVDEGWHRQLRACLAPFNPVTDPLLCVDAPVHAPQDKAALAAQALACDMESAAVLRIASRHGVPAAIARVVLDGPKDRLPVLVSSLIDRHGNFRWPGAAACLAAVPQLGAMLRLAARFLRARRQLIEVVQRLLAGQRTGPN